MENFIFCAMQSVVLEEAIHDNFIYIIISYYFYVIPLRIHYLLFIMIFRID